MSPAKTLPELLRQGGARPTAPFLLCAERDWSYGECLDAVETFAAGLSALGVGKGARVAIAAPNSAQWVITWLAVVRLGAILVPLNVAYREREFDYMLNQSGAGMLICCSRDGEFDFVEFLQGMRPRLPAVQQYVFIGAGGFDGSHRWEDVPAAAQNANAHARSEVAVGPQDPAVILYTSGTTGEPKGATLTHAGILASAAAQAEHLGQTSDDVAIGHMPLNHVGGMTCTVAASMVAGGSVALLARYNPLAALDAIKQRRVSIFIGVPTMYTTLLGQPGFSDADISCVRLCIIGGSNVEPSLGRRIADTFGSARLANLYGLSESSGGCLISAKDDGLDTLLETLGVAIGGFDIRVVDAAGQPLGPGREGELQIRGPCVAAGYWGKPGESAGTFLPGGWLASGDIAIVRADGRVALRGRKKEMFIRGGFNVYPAEVENTLRSDEAVAMCAVIGVPDAKFGEVGHAFVVAAPGRRVDVEALYRRCRQRLARYKVPDAIHIVDSLPMTPAGKIRKVAIRESMIKAQRLAG